MIHPARGDTEAYQRYFAGMDASMDQKAGFLSAHLVTDPGARILDLGCGSGALSARMAALAPQARVTGIDIDAGTIDQATAAYAMPNLDFQVGDAAAAWAPADAVVSCSLLHHVYTYAPRPYDEAAAEAALQAHVASLRPGGLLVLRDFCRDGVPDETCLLDLPDAPHPDGRSDADLLRDFAVRARPLDPLGGGFPLEELGTPEPGWRRFRLHRHWSAEFLLRKDYREDWEAELREEYAFWPLRHFAAIVEAAGARVVHAAVVRNPWVARNRFEGRARRLDERLRPLPWPATNMVLVAERLSAGRALRLRHRRLDPAPASYLRLSAWRDPAGETLDLVQRPTGAVDFLPYAIQDGRLRVLARNGWPRPAMVMMGRGDGTRAEIRSGHVVEMISLASDGTDPAADFQARSGLNLPPGVQPDPILAFLPSAGLVDEVARGFVVPLDALPSRRPAPRPPGQALECGVLQSFDAAGLLRAAEVGMLPEARLELTIRALFRRLGLSAGRWAGETVEAPPCDISPMPLAEACQPAGLPFLSAPPTRYLQRIRSVFTETLTGPGGTVLGGEQVLEMAVPAHHSAWTVSVLPVGREPSGAVLIGLERQVLPSAQLGFDDAALPTVPAWRLGVLPDAPEPLRAAAAQLAGCDPAALTALGAAYYPSLGLSPERMQPFVVPAAALPQPLRDKLRFVRLPDLLDQAGAMRDGHLLIAAFRLACAVGLA